MTEIAFGAVGEPIEATQRRVRLAARALGRHGLGHAFGHVSARLDDDTFLVCAPRPMGTIAPGAAGTVVPVEGALPQGVLGEVRVHQQIYRRRPDVGGICRTFLAKVLTLSAMRLTPQPRHGFASYFAPAAPLWDSPLLLRNDADAAGLAETLGAARAVVMRGNGCVLVGASVEEAIVMAFFLEQAADTELAVLAAGPGVDAPVMSAEDCAARAVATGGIYERMWDWLTFGDPER